MANWQDKKITILGLGKSGYSAAKYLRQLGAHVLISESGHLTGEQTAWADELLHLGVDIETGETLPPGKQGELCTRGYHVMRGYYKMPDETARAIDSENWLHTGDLAIMDDHGYCKITGRIKNMIIRGGENIYPREIEEFLYTHPKVSDIQVYGVPDRKYGEQVMAAVILKNGVEMSEEEIREFCRGKIANYKIPKYVKFVDSYPMTASGKIQKFKMREMAIKELQLEDMGATA